MVADSSALYAIAFDEDDSSLFLKRIGRAARTMIGAPTAFEFRLVVFNRHGAGYLPIADRLLATPQFEIVDWTANLVALATDAVVRFGGRPARLNFGNCMAYALARHHDAPLLYKGADFAATDVRSALD